MESNFEGTTIVSFSDVEPIENLDIPAATQDGYDLDRLDFSSQYTNPNGMGKNDRYTGTQRADTYQFKLLMNAKMVSAPEERTTSMFSVRLPSITMVILITLKMSVSISCPLQGLWHMLS